MVVRVLMSSQPPPPPPPPMWAKPPSKSNSNKYGPSDIDYDNNSNNYNKYGQISTSATTSSNNFIQTSINSSGNLRVSASTSSAATAAMGGWNAPIRFNINNNSRKHKLDSIDYPPITKTSIYGPASESDSDSSESSYDRKSKKRRKKEQKKIKKEKKKLKKLKKKKKKVNKYGAVSSDDDDDDDDNDNDYNSDSSDGGKYGRTINNHSGSIQDRLNFGLSNSNNSNKKTNGMFEITAKDKGMLNSRAARFEKEQIALKDKGVKAGKLTSVAQLRARSSGSSSKRNIATDNNKTVGNNNDLSELSSEELHKLRIVGTCKTLEKDYFRLTQVPHPSTIRPAHIIQEALDSLMNKWNYVYKNANHDCSIASPSSPSASNESNTNMTNYEKTMKEKYIYYCSQFKALRQDLTVQNIRNELSVKVYEEHARVALICKDTNEYNQCQTQLKQLYAEGINGNEVEFLAYRILYNIYIQYYNSKYDGGSAGMTYLLQEIIKKPDMYNHHVIQHALRVREAVANNSYHHLSVLYNNTPNLGRILFNLMTWRYDALRSIVKCYKPNISADFVLRELGFNKSARGIKFLRASGIQFIQSDSNNSRSNNGNNDNNDNDTENSSSSSSSSSGSGSGSGKSPKSKEFKPTGLLIDCQNSVVEEIDAGNDLL